MNDVTVATANIYWYGLKQAVASSKGLDIGFFHTNEDDLRLATMLSRIGADLFCFQEIVDVVRFEEVLTKANAALRVRDDEGHMVSSLPVSDALDTKQRVVLAWNAQKLSLVNWKRLPIWTRSPVFAEFEHQSSGRRLQVTGTHAKSSAPEADGAAGQVKRRELTSLAEWATLETEAGRLGDVVMLGDLNSVHGGEDANYLTKGALAAWHWRQAAGDTGSLWTTTTDLVVIDHILVSPGLAVRVARWPEIVYFDRDPGVPGPLPQQALIPGMLKGLTDHRPVRMALRLGD